jgi:hypothetical protein
LLDLRWQASPIQFTHKERVLFSQRHEASL